MSSHSLSRIMRVFGLLLCSLLFLGSALGYKSYSGYQVLQTKVLDDASLLKLAPLFNRPEFDFFSTPRVGRAASIMASPEHVPILRNNLARLGLEPTLLINDVQVVIEEERTEIEGLKRSSQRTGRAPDLSRYLEFEEIQSYLDEVAAAFPNIATIIEIGSSFEGRPLRVLKISSGSGKPGMFFDAAIHAREWAGPPTILFAINELTENLANNQAMLDKNDFYFLPVANPDGYAYTWSNDRMWRKTRRPNAGSSCAGTDPNRNFDIAWAGGGIPSTCSETYPGSSAFSEVEVKAIGDFLTANPSITFALSVHSYGQYLLYPYGDTTQLPPTVAELERVGSAALDALAAIRGTQYELGSISNVLYLAYGGSTDYAYGALNIPLAYTIELPGGGSGGFNPPNSAITPVTTETWEAYKVFAANIPATRG